MSKLSKTAKILSMLLNCICWIVLIGSLLYGIFAISSCIHLSTADNAGEAFVSGITLDYMEFYSSTGGISVDSSSLLKMNLVSLIVYFVEVPLICCGIQLLRKVFLPMTQCRPFSGTGIILRKMGYISLSIAAVENISDWMMVNIMKYDYRLSELFMGSVITDVNIHFKMDGTFILASAVFLLLSCVFCYGEELQQLSDETL